MAWTSERALKADLHIYFYKPYFDYKEEVSYNQPEFLPLFEKETPFKIFLTLDGDYM